MINGEGTPGSLSGTSPSLFDEFPPWAAENLGQKSEDASPTLSNFSSREGSDFERYCSANSVMGTPSMCSSVGNHADLFGASDFGSLKNLGFGGDEFALDSCDLWETPESNFGSQSTAALGASKTSTSDGVGSLRDSLSSNSGSSLRRHKLSFIAGNHLNSQLSLRSGSSHEDDDNEVRTESLSSPKLDTYYGDAYERKNSENLSSSNAGMEPGVLSDLAEVTLSHMPISTENNDVRLMMSRTKNGAYGLVGYINSVVLMDAYEKKHSLNVMKEVIDDPNSSCSVGAVFQSDAEQLKRDTYASADVEVEALDNCEYSDDEDSVDYGTDEEKGVHAYKTLNQLCETKLINENPLLINSTVAFGSDDWDDFEQGAWDYGLNSVTSCKFHENQYVHEKTLENAGVRYKSEVCCQVEAAVVSPKPLQSCPATKFSPKPLQSCPATKFSPKEDLPSSTIQEVGCSDRNSNAIENFTKEEKDASKRVILCVCSNACTCRRDPMDPLSDFMTNNVSSSVNESFQESVVQTECESNAHVCSREDMRIGKDLMEKSDSVLNPLSDTMTVELPFDPCEELQNKEGKFQEHYELNVLPLMTEEESFTDLKQILNDRPLNDLVRDCIIPDKFEKLGTLEFYEEMVYDMEKILLDSGESHTQRATEYFSPRGQQFRDGGSTASTSGRDDSYPLIIYPLKIDWVEVIGAKQKRGDVSLGERLVGVKEYTVYIMRVWSGKEQWEVEHRYRDFFHLYRQLKAFYWECGQVLPLPWLKVERDSRKIFGNASPTVINERSFLIQDCLRSILDLQSVSGTPNCLLWFLAPSRSLSVTSLSNHSGRDPMYKNPNDGNIEPYNEEALTLGKTISLIVDMQPHKPVKQLLDAQHYMCAGCHKHFDFGKTVMSDFAKTLGWGKPRICEYTGQLFCASCHTNETAVLPARVLHLWDFALYPVSQLAKAYLESIYDQPMLCVTAVNPLLFSKVPALLHVMSIRKKMGSMVPYVRCPFRRSIQKGLGSRRYLLESSEFFALRDLVDLSKGAFAVLPVMMENVSKKILEHITQQCLVCCDVGIMCGSRQACEDPSSLIFPFQEDEIMRCKSCNSAFHKSCYMKLMICPCRRPANEDSTVLLAEQAKHIGSDELIEDSLMMARKPDSESVVGFFSKMFAKAKQEIAWKARDRNPIILMGSMPSTSL